MAPRRTSKPGGATRAAPAAASSMAVDQRPSGEKTGLMHLPSEIRMIILADAMRLPDQLQYWCACQGAPADHDTQELHDNVEVDYGLPPAERIPGRRCALDLPCARGDHCRARQRGFPHWSCCNQCEAMMAGADPMDDPRRARSGLCYMCRRQTMAGWLALVRTNRQLRDEAQHVFVRRAFTIRVFRSVVRFGNWRGTDALHQMRALRIWQARAICIEVHDHHTPDTQASFVAVCDALRGGGPEPVIARLKIHNLVSCSMLSAASARGPEHGDDDVMIRLLSPDGLMLFKEALAGVNMRTLELLGEFYPHCFSVADDLFQGETEAHRNTLALDEPGPDEPAPGDPAPDEPMQTREERIHWLVRNHFYHYTQMEIWRANDDSYNEDVRSFGSPDYDMDDVSDADDAADTDEDSDADEDL